MTKTAQSVQIAIDPGTGKAIDVRELRIKNDEL